MKCQESIPSSTALRLMKYFTTVAALLATATPAFAGTLPTTPSVQAGKVTLVVLASLINSGTS